MSDTPGNEAEILGAAQEAVYAGRFEAALEELDTLLVADVPDALYMAAVCERYLKRHDCLLYTSPSPRDVEESRMPSSA